MSFGGALLGSALGVGGLLSNSDNNRLQQQMWQQSYDFQRYQYEDSKKYNSAQEQVRRLRAAGINPSIAFGDNAGTTSAVSSPSPANTNPLDLSGLSSIANSISLNDAQVRNLDSTSSRNDIETEGAKIDLGFKTEDWLSKLYNRDADSWYKNQISDNMRLNNEYLSTTLADRVHQAKMESQLAQAKSYAQFYLLPYVPLKAQAELENLYANTKLALDSGVATLKQAHAAIMNAKVSQDALKAQYGESEVMRKLYSRAVYKGLIQDINTSKSNEWKNFSTSNPLPKNKSVREDYESWRDHRQYNSRNYMPKD